MNSHQTFKNALQIAAEALQQAAIFWDDAQQDAVRYDQEGHFLKVTQGEYPDHLPEFSELATLVYKFSKTVNENL